MGQQKHCIIQCFKDLFSLSNHAVGDPFLLRKAFIVYMPKNLLLLFHHLQVLLDKQRFQTVHIVSLLAYMGIELVVFFIQLCIIQNSLTGDAVRPPPKSFKSRINEAPLHRTVVCYYLYFDLPDVFLNKSYHIAFLINIISASVPNN